VFICGGGNRCSAFYASVYHLSAELSIFLRDSLCELTGMLIDVNRVACGLLRPGPNSINRHKEEE